MLVENELDAYIGGFHLDALSSGLAAQRRRGHHPHRARRPQPESDSALGRASLGSEHDVSGRSPSRHTVMPMCGWLVRGAGLPNARH